MLGLLQTVYNNSVSIVICGKNLRERERERERESEKTAMYLT